MSIGTPKHLSALPAPCSPGHTGILVVDEDPAFVLGLKTFLREYVGFDRVLTARNGAEALCILESDPEIEVVTLDSEMSGLDGIGLLESISRRKLDRPLSVVMITGRPTEDLADRFRSFSSPSLLARHYLTKPIEFEKLEPVVLRAHEELQVAKETRIREMLMKQEEEELAAAEAARVAMTSAPVGEVSAGRSDPEEPEPFSGEPVEWERLISMEADLARHETKLDHIIREVNRVKRSVRCSFWSLLLVAALVWAWVHYGWSNQVEPYWEQAKAWSVATYNQVRESLSETFAGDRSAAASDGVSDPVDGTTAPETRGEEDSQAPAAREEAEEAEEAEEEPEVAPLPVPVREGQPL